MNAVEYLKQKDRMCKSFNRHCNNCPMYNGNAFNCLDMELNDPDEAVDLVVTWVSEHPVYLNADKFKEVFGIYATEIWSAPEERFLKWLNSEYKEGGGL